MNLRNLSKTIGPGLLFASTAIGVSHLVQSTRAGANYGFVLVGFIIAANVFKFPFFEYGSRYANATGESLIDGYKRVGKWMLWMYFLIVLGSMFFVTSAVGFVTAGFMKNLFSIPSEWGVMFTPTLLFLCCSAILVSGRFSIFNNLMQVIAIVLLVSTIVAFILTLFHGKTPSVEGFVSPEIFNEKGILFIIALMGWMPTAVDLSTWNSLWTVAKIKDSHYQPTLKETLFEFNLGYWISAGLSICFVTLGAFLWFGSGQEMSPNGAVFANQVVTLYTSSIGNWSYWIIAAAAFSIMLGTSLGVFDGYARSLQRTMYLLFFNDKSNWSEKKLVYTVCLLITALGSYSIIFYFSDKPNGFKGLVDLATTISFLVSPLIAIVNFKLVSKKYIQESAVPPLGMRLLSYGGIIFLTGFAVYFLWMKF